MITTEDKKRMWFIVEKILDALPVVATVKDDRVFVSVAFEENGEVLHPLTKKPIKYRVKDGGE